MIGIFDSGSGGLTVLKALRVELPSADVVYFGDIGNAPYGSKSREELSMLTVEALTLLKKHKADRIVSACNSTSASLAVSLYDAFSLSSSALVEMVGPTVAYFKGSPARIAIAATVATIDSGIYQSAFAMIGKKVAAIAIPELAGAIEFGAPQAEIDRIVTEAFQGIPRDFDVLVLACTHYPLVLPAFARTLGDIPVFDPAVLVAERARELFWPQEVGEGTTRFLISRDSAPFRALVARMFPKDAKNIEVLE
jgi:glutamate racemase